MSDEQPTVGQQLAEARREAGLNVDEVSARTRIRATVIRAIENDDFRFSGGDIYARGHIRAIAGVVGIDATGLIAQFDGERAPHGPAVTEVFEHETKGYRPRRNGPNWTAVMTAALVLAVGAISYQVVTSAGKPARTPTTVAQSSPTPVETITPTPSSSPTDSPVAQAPRTSVALILSTVNGKRSWVSVSNATGQLYQGILDSGQVKSFADKRTLSVVVGDASAISLTVNGVDVGPLGGAGQVVRQTFGPNDPTGSSG